MARKKHLEPRQLRFVEEYLLDLNALQAAIRAGYSAKTAKQQGARLLTNADIAAAIQQAQVTRSQRTGITQDRVLEALEELAFSDITHYAIDPRGEVTLVEGAPKRAMRAIASVKHKTIPYGKDDVIHEVEVKLWDKPGTLKLAGRHVGLFPDRVEHTGKNGGPIAVDTVRTMSDTDLRAEIVKLLEKV